MIEFIIWFIACFFSTLGIVYIYYKFVNVDKISLGCCIFFLIGVFLITIIRYYHIYILNYIFYFLFYPLLFYFLKRLTLKHIIYYTVIIWFYGMALDLLSMFILSLLSLFLDLNVYENIIYNTGPVLITFLLMLCIGNCSIIKNFTYSFYERLNKIKHYDLILIILSLFTLIVAIAISLNIKTLSIGGLLILLILMIFMFFFLIIYVKFIVYENNAFINILKDNNAFYIKVDEENRVFKHNLMAKLLSIKSVANKSARLLIDDLLSEFNSNVDFLNHIKNIPYGINGIVYQKVYPYLGIINVKIDNKLDVDVFKLLKPRRYNVFVEKLIVSIDNAIEASLESVDKMVIINLYINDNIVFIELKNSFNANLDLDLLGTVNYSTKHKKRGLGIFSMLRNNEVKTNVKIVNGYFITILEAKINKNELDN